MTSSKAASLASSPFVVGALSDVSFFLLTPLAIAPAVFGLITHASAEQVANTILAVGAIGHHLPGMLRAYADRQLRQRFRVRLLVAPLGFIALCAFAQAAQLQGLMLYIFIWGIWHAHMQTYGFMRLYAAKARDFNPVTARLDWLLCGLGFVAVVMFSPMRAHFILAQLARCGVPVPSPTTWWFIRAAVLTLFGAVLIVSAGRALQPRRYGPASPLKWLLLCVSLGFWAFANIAVENVLLALPLFEVFHDIQYLALVYALHHHPARAANLPPRLTAVFAGSLSGVVIYVGACALYGSLGLLAQPLLTDFRAAGLTLGVLLQASTLFHFYLDGFIYKQRDTLTSPVLSARGQQATVNEHHVWRIPRYTLPLLLAQVGQQTASAHASANATALLEIFPNNPVAIFQVAEHRYNAGDIAGALAGYRQSLAIDQHYAPASGNLHQTLLEVAEDALADRRVETAHAALKEAEGLQPNTAAALLTKAQELARNHASQALKIYALYLLLRPRDARARLEVAQILVHKGEDEQAWIQLRHVLNHEPHNEAANALKAQLRR